MCASCCSSARWNAIIDECSVIGLPLVPVVLSIHLRVGSNSPVNNSLLVQSNSPVSFTARDHTNGALVVKRRHQLLRIILLLLVLFSQRSL